MNFMAGLIAVGILSIGPILMTAGILSMVAVVMVTAAEDLKKLFQARK